MNNKVCAARVGALIWPAMTAVFIQSQPAFAAETTPESLDCARVAAFIEGRFPDAAKARLQELAPCESEAEAPGALRVLESIAAQWSEMERQFAVASAAHGNASDELEHLRKAVTLDPANAPAAAALQKASARQVAVKVKAAEMLQRIGKGDEALTALSEARVLNADHPDVTKLEQSIKDQLRQALETKLKLAQYDDAVKDLQKLAEVDAAVSVEDEIAKDRGLRRHRTRTLVESWGLYLGEILLVATLGIWVLSRIWKRYLSRPLLELNTFDNSSSAPGFEYAIVATLTALSRGSGRAAAALHNVTLPLEGAKLPVEVISAMPPAWGWAKVIPVIIELVFPRRRLPIRGVLHKDSERGNGVTVEVMTLSGDNLSETFWANDYGLDAQEGDKAEDETHYPLAEYVAIWLLFQLSTRELRLLGTQRWQSFAFFRAGVHAERSNRVLAKTFYLKSLRADDNLHAARLNLALLAEGSDRLLVVDMLKRAAACSERTDATRYHARYALAARQFDRGEIDEALAQATVLLTDIAATCWQYGFYDLRMTALKGLSDDAPDQPSVADRLTALYMRAKPHAELENFLGYLLPILRAMWAGIRFSKDADDPNALVVLNEIAGADHSPRVLYNLACAYSLRAGRLRAAKMKNRRVADLRLSLEKLQRALWLSSAIGRYAQVHRSLACVRDSTDLIDRKAARDHFAELMARYVPRDQSQTSEVLPLEEFALAGMDARKLADNNIKTSQELVDSCETAHQRSVLAATLQLGARQVKRWAQTVELTRIFGISPKQTSLLNQCQVFSLAELAAQNSANLANDLADWAITLKMKAPSSDQVKRWIVEAQAIATYIR